MGNLKKKKVWTSCQSHKIYWWRGKKDKLGPVCCLHTMQHQHLVVQWRKCRQPLKKCNQPFVWHFGNLICCVESLKWETFNNQFISVWLRKPETIEHNWNNWSGLMMWWSHCYCKEETADWCESDAHELVIQSKVADRAEPEWLPVNNSPPEAEKRWLTWRSALRWRCFYRGQRRWTAPWRWPSATETPTACGWRERWRPCLLHVWVIN